MCGAAVGAMALHPWARTARTGHSAAHEPWVDREGGLGLGRALLASPGIAWGRTLAGAWVYSEIRGALALL